MRRITLFKLTVTILLPLTIVFRAVGQLPVANFSASPTSGCSPFTVQFTDQSSGNPFSWNWDFGNGQLSTLQNPAVTFSNAGSYTVKLIVKNSAGLGEEIKTNYITVAPAPSASFSSNLTLACTPGTIQFIDQSTSPPAAGSITGWYWTFGDGGTSTQKNPVHVYTAPGYYTITLTITSVSGCQNTTSIGRYIRIISGIDVNFNWSQPLTCQAPYPVNFQDQSNGPGVLSYQWNFGGSTSTLQNPSATFATGGTYPVTLQVNSNLGCTGTITKDVPVSGKTTDFTAPAVACIGQTLNFKNNSSPPPVSSFWNFGDGTTSSQTNPVKMFLTAGTYAVKMINNYGNCKDSIVKNITITSSPPVNFIANDSTACKAPFTVHFTDQSPAAAAWLWDFGDSSTSTQQNPSHTYTSPGVYTVTLTIFLSGGCTATITKQQFIKIAPTTVSITPLPNGGCIPYSYSPIPILQSVDSIVSYSWNMGEPGGIYNVANPTHVYNSAGNYNVTLTVTTQTGCTITSAPLTVLTGTKPNVNFSFTPNNVCASTPVQFTDSSITSPGAVVKYVWKFGDGDISTDQNPIHVFQDTGTISVLLIVSNNGCKDSITKHVAVIPPVAIFGYRVNCNNRRQVTFLDSSMVNPAYGPITYQWKMGDPANTVFNGLPPPTFTYPAFGTYIATLIVTNGACTYQTTKQIVLSNVAPGFTISKNPVCKSQTFALSAVVSDPTAIKDYTWLISNPGLLKSFPDTTQTISTSLPTYGQYTVTLITEGINGCIDSTTIPNFITVGGPVANFSNSTGGCINSNIGFTDQSTPPASIRNWVWVFGDGTQQSYNSPPFSHIYTATGSYTVSLMIKDDAGCADTMIHPNSVLITDPIAGFMADTIYCPLSPLQFTDTSYGTGLTYAWNFGDGGTSALQNPTHNYPNGDDFYTIKLRITDSVGCRDSITKVNYIHIRSPQSAFSLLDSTGICLPTVINFVFQGKYYQSYHWDFDDGAQTTSENPAHFYNAYGTYYPKLILVGPGGCTDTAQKLVQIYDPGSTSHITGDVITGCNRFTTNFSLVTPPGFRFKFYYGDGDIDSSGQFNLTHTYLWPGNYNPYVYLLDNYGCETGVYGPPIHVYGALPIFAMNQKEFCDLGQVFFTNRSISNDSIVSTLWNFGDGSSSTLIEPTHIFTPANSYYVTLTLTTKEQCVSSSKDTVRIYPTPHLSIKGRDTICFNTAEQFGGVLALPDSTIKWYWSFGNGDSSHVQNGVVSYSGIGNFNINLIVVNKLGCTDSASHMVNVVPLPTAVAVSDPIKILSGGTAQLGMNYTGPIVSYNWKPPQTLSCANCPTPSASPRVSTKYTVDVVDRFGCRNEGLITVNVACNGENFFVPNSFSPNGDGVNDVFYLRGSGLFRVKTMRVFDRWGEVVFEKTEVPVNNPAFGWDGKYKGVPAQPGVYIYQLEIICNNGELLKYSGNVALML